MFTLLDHTILTFLRSYYPYHNEETLRAEDLRKYYTLSPHSEVCLDFSL
jgi:hypothetical protein